MQLPKTSENGCDYFMSPWRQIDQSAIAAVGCTTLDIAQVFKLAEQIVHSLSRHPLLTRELGRSDAIRQRKREHGKMRLLEVNKPCLVNGLQHTVAHMLPDNAQQRAKNGGPGNASGIECGDNGIDIYVKSLYVLM